MGVTGLWQIVQPCARPIKIETLNRKRLAVDASIWIYQFLKAVRDKEGNALRNSHVVGFFRRICKLLFFGIKPVFVFDGGAPALKRQTIRARKARREGRREDAVRTAGKLLAVQMQRRAEEEEAQRKADSGRAPEQEETVPDEGLVYVDELQMTQQERQQNRKFKKKDQYHLPDLDVSMTEMGGPNDMRVMSLEELQAYARQFETGEDINVYDFSKIDYDSAFFMSLPATDRYNILNAARLRSRLRMGHSKEQLDSMFPDRMAFSKFQIERVRERNELTQRLMNLNGFETMEFGGGRVAGEKGREYVLVKNDGVEGGWALGVISDEGKQEKPIDVDRPAPRKDESEDEGLEDDEDFEDIPIEGLNRLPKIKNRNEQMTDDLMRQRRAIYNSRRSVATRRPKVKRTRATDPDSLFIQDSEEEVEHDGHDKLDTNDELFEDGEEDSELQRAIAMSLGKNHAEMASPEGHSRNENDSDEDNMLEKFQQKAVSEQRPVPKGSGRNIANIVNKRAFNVAPESREITSFGVPTLKSDESDDDDGIDFQAALAESRRNKRKTSPSRRQPPSLQTEQSAREIAKKAGFQGPLPFEKLDLGISLLGKKKMQQRTEEAAGGFENPQLAKKENKKQAEPLPPWFSGDLEADIRAQEAIEAEDRRNAREYGQQYQFQQRADTLRHEDTNEVIDLDADEERRKGYKNDEIIDIDAEESKAVPVDHAIRMGDMAEEVRADPAVAAPTDKDAVPQVRNAADITNQSSTVGEHAVAPTKQDRSRFDAGISVNEKSKRSEPQQEASEDDEEMIEWSESDREDEHHLEPSMEIETYKNGVEGTSDIVAAHGLDSATRTSVEGTTADISQMARQRSPSAEVEDVEFEDVAIPDAPARPHPVSRVEFETPAVLDEEDESGPAPASGLVKQESAPDYDEFDDFSDPEDAEILRALTQEAEEHARFASSLNNKTQAQNIQDYERELKQLRNQQKKDRRDADEVTQIMIQECQALLRLFGLPYITAPMEAEAQCAELVRLGLVDGIVTDDSDCFLFGGTRIYKNMFNQAKFVECYLTSDLEKEFALNRDKLIAVAHLLGSDYTEGLPGIGPVTAIEIVSEFQTLEAFKEWWTGVQMNQISKSEDAKNAFRKKFRRNATKLFLPPSFPDQRVNLAYQNPEVDADPESFQWGVPDLDALRAYLMATIGWSQDRTDEVLVPVIRDMNRRADEGTQANLTHFFQGTVGIGAAGSSNAGRGEGFAPRKRLEGSKRMGTALSKMAERAKMSKDGSISDEPAAAEQATGTHSAAEGSDVGHSAKNPPRKRKPAKNAAVPAVESGDDEDSNFDEPEKKKAKKRGHGSKTSARKKRQNQPVDSD